MARNSRNQERKVIGKRSIDSTREFLVEITNKVEYRKLVDLLNQHLNNSTWNIIGSKHFKRSIKQISRASAAHKLYHKTGDGPILNIRVRLKHSADKEICSFLAINGFTVKEEI